MSRQEPITDCGCPYEDGRRQGHSERCPTLVALTWPDGTPKIAPVQGFVAGIPWSMQLRAYDAYCAKWGGQAALIDLDRRGCRGGFSTGELDQFIPGWRVELSELTGLRDSLRTLARAMETIAAHVTTMGREGSAEFHAGCEAVANDCVPIFERVGMELVDEGWGFDNDVNDVPMVRQ